MPQPTKHLAFRICQRHIARLNNSLGRKTVPPPACYVPPPACHFESVELLVTRHMKRGHYGLVPRIRRAREQHNHRVTRQLAREVSLGLNDHAKNTLSGRGFVGPQTQCNVGNPDSKRWTCSTPTAPLDQILAREGASPQISCLGCC